MKIETTFLWLLYRFVRAKFYCWCALAHGNYYYYYTRLTASFSG